MKTKKLLLAAFFMLFIPLLMFAQCNTDPSADGTNDPENCPLDSWLVVLLVAGAGYGFFKHKKEEKILAK